MWEIYAYQNADSLFGVFNAAAAIHASSDYAAAVAAVAFCGFVAALIAYAFAPEKLQGWKWLATVVLVFSVLIVPKVTVGIVDKTGGSAVKVVDNVPFGVAVLGSLTSTIGNTLTGLFETAFQVIPGIGALPAELSYQQNGLMFGNRLIRETGNVVFQDPAFRTDLINFIHNCTTYDLIDGTLDPATFSASDDVWPLMASPNPARFSTLTAAGGSVGVDTCP
ncbi:MAG: conjugal transfer protein TraG N-terminal domain-containing protein, partial [Proteobacteria bacterium]|nr:conjugal transfer protein TraG N-terminal domain-containing protein [Pseudomonadota bacterium]